MIEHSKDVVMLVRWYSAKFKNSFKRRLCTASGRGNPWHNQKVPLMGVCYSCASWAWLYSLTSFSPKPAGRTLSYSYMKTSLSPLFFFPLSLSVYIFFLLYHFKLFTSSYPSCLLLFPISMNIYKYINLTFNFPRFLFLPLFVFVSLSKFFYYNILLLFHSYNILF